MDAAEILAILALASARRGETSVARAQLLECTELIRKSTSRRAISTLLESAARVAAQVGADRWAVELYSARERIAKRFNEVEADDVTAERNEAVQCLKARIGAAAFDEAWTAARATRFPIEVYIAKTMEWLERLGDGDAQGSGGLDRRSDESVPDRSARADSTAVLLELARGGDPMATERLAGRHLEDLRRFAHGRLPRRARSMLDTADLVQITIIRALSRLEAIRPSPKGGFLAYLRKIMTNQIRDQHRRSSIRPVRTELSDEHPSNAPTPLEELIGRQALETYEKGLEKLPARQREAVILRVERGYSYDAIAAAIDCPSANAARMLVTRALESLAKKLRRQS